MSYTRNPTWHDFPATDTPITAAALENIENGIVAAAATADSASSGLASKVDTGDSRLSDARTPLAHTHAESEITGLVSDLAAKALNTVTVSAGTGLTGGGDLTANRTLSVSFGTTAGTVAAGDDSRITGAAQKASNLSDLANVATARTNLGVSATGSQVVNAQTGTTYSVQASDVGKLVTLSNAGAITVTVPAVLTAGQRVDFLVIGAGLPTFVGSGVTINGYPSLVAKAQWTAFTVVCYASNAVAVVGGLA